MNNAKNILKLEPYPLSEKIRKKWGTHLNDFVTLTLNGSLVNDSLYRVGGFGANLNDDYFMLLKYNNPRTSVNSEFSLLGWCIFDKDGNEKKLISPYDPPYIMGGSRIYSLNNKLYDVETGEFYCDSSPSFESNDYIFADNRFDSDPSKKGVMKISKKDGTWEVFPLTPKGWKK